MEGTPFFSLAELLQEAALQQAAERTQIGIIERDVDTADAVTLSSRPKLDAVDHVKEQTEELLASLLDEKAKNDALSRQIESTLEQLARDPISPTKRSRKHTSEELEWQQLEFAIQAVDHERKQVPALDSTTVLDARARFEVHDIGSQYDIALEKLKLELAGEKDSLDRENQLLSDLSIVRQGLFKREAQLQQKKDKDPTSALATRELSEKRNRETKRFATLLDKLLVVGEALFSGQNDKVVTLRYYLDTLLNRVWDRPLDPWVRPQDLIHGKRSSQVDEAMIQLFLRANVIVAHPKDARKWKMVAFHKPTRASA